MMRISFLLTAKNGVTGPVNSALRSIRQISKVTGASASSFNKLGETVHNATGRMTRDMSRTATAAGSMVKRMGASFAGIYDFTRDAGHHFRRIVGEEGMERAGRSVAYLRNQVAGLTGGLTLLKYASVAATIGLGEEFVRGVFKAGGDTQQLVNALEVLTRSRSKAVQGVDWLRNFAIGPGASFSMPDLMKSYQMSMDFGANPQNGSFAAYADLAAAWRRPMAGAVMAVRDAVEGVSTRPLALLGIRLRQGRNGAPDNFQYALGNGRFATMTSANNPEARLATINRIIGMRYGGAATAQANTLPGGIAQLRKMLYMFQGKVAGSGVFDWALGQLNRFFAYIRKISANGSLDGLAKRISKFMTDTGDKIINFVKTTDWKAVGKDIGALGTALGGIATGLNLVSTLGGGGITGLLNLFVAGKVFGFTRAMLGLVAPIWSVSTALFTLDAAALPITAVVALIAAVAAGAWLVYSNWSSWGPKIKGFFQGLWDGIKAIMPKSWGDLLPFLANPPAFIAGKVVSALGAKMGPAASPETPRQKWLREHPNTDQQRAADRARAQDIARADIRIKVDGNPNAVQVEALHRAEGVNLSVKRGIAMGNPG